MTCLTRSCGQLYNSFETQSEGTLVRRRTFGVLPEAMMIRLTTTTIVAHTDV